MAGSDGIIQLSSRRQDAMDREREALVSYWREIGGGSDVPRRDDIDPARIAASLSRIVVIERIAPRQARIRLAGQCVTEGLGLDPRGMPLTCLVTPESAEWLGDALEKLFDGPSRVDLGLMGPRVTFRKRPVGGLMLLPLRDRADEITRAIGIVDLPERRGSAPVRFEIAGDRAEELATRAERPPLDEPMLPDFDAADRARDALRRRAAFHLVD